MAQIHDELRQLFDSDNGMSEFSDAEWLPMLEQQWLGLTVQLENVLAILRRAPTLAQPLTKMKADLEKLLA